MTKQELRRYSRLNIELKRLEEKIETLEAKITSPKNQTLSHMPRGGPVVDLTEQVSKLIDLKNQYNATWDELISEQKRIEQAIVTLDDPIERALMGYRYIDGLSWEEVCIRIKYCWVQTHKYHSSALAKLKSE